MSVPSAPTNLYLMASSLSSITIFFKQSVDDIILGYNYSFDDITYYSTNISYNPNIIPNYNSVTISGITQSIFKIYLVAYNAYGRGSSVGSITLNTKTTDLINNNNLILIYNLNPNKEYIVDVKALDVNDDVLDTSSNKVIITPQIIFPKITSINVIDEQKKYIIYCETYTLGSIQYQNSIDALTWSTFSDSSINIINSSTEITFNYTNLSDNLYLRIIDFSGNYSAFVEITEKASSPPSIVTIIDYCFSYISDTIYLGIIPPIHGNPILNYQFSFDGINFTNINLINNNIITIENYTNYVNVLTIGRKFNIYLRAVNVIGYGPKSYKLLSTLSDRPCPNAVTINSIQYSADVTQLYLNITIPTIIPIVYFEYCYDGINFITNNLSISGNIITISNPNTLSNNIYLRGVNCVGPGPSTSIFIGNSTIPSKVNINYINYSNDGTELYLYITPPTIGNVNIHYEYCFDENTIFITNNLSVSGNIITINDSPAGFFINLRAINNIGPSPVTSYPINQKAD